MTPTDKPKRRNNPAKTRLTKKDESQAEKERLKFEHDLWDTMNPSNDDLEDDYDDDL